MSVPASRIAALDLQRRRFRGFQLRLISRRSSQPSTAYADSRILCSPPPFKQAYEDVDCAAMIRDWAGNASSAGSISCDTQTLLVSEKKIWQFPWFHSRRVLFGFILKAHAVGESASILSKNSRMVAS